MLDWLSSLPGRFDLLSQGKFYEGVTLIAIFGGAIGLLKFLFEYVRDNRRKRLGLYVKLSDEFRTNNDFASILVFLDEYEDCPEPNKKELAERFTKTVSVDTRSEFAAFLEQVAITVQSGAMKGRLANYMCGHYAILCWENEPFWIGVRKSKDEEYWAILK